MFELKRSILTAIAVMALASASAPADEGRSSLTKPPAGSIAAQLRLKMKLHRITSGSLAASLKHNRREWESLTPDQRGRFRKSFLAFLHKSPGQQEKLLVHYEALFKMTAERREAYRQRAKWLDVVVRSFTPEQRQALQEMPPDDRARKILARKAELLKQGRLEVDAPTSAPASAPAGPRM